MKPKDIMTIVQASLQAKGSMAEVQRRSRSRSRKRAVAASLQGRTGTNEIVNEDVVRLSSDVDVVGRKIELRA